MARSGLDRYIQGAGGQFTVAGGQNVEQAVGAAIRRGTHQIGILTTDLGGLLGVAITTAMGDAADVISEVIVQLDYTQKHTQSIAKSMERIGRHGQAETVKAYKQNVLDKRRVPSYKTNSHLGDGALADLLGSTDFIKVTNQTYGNTIEFGNVIKLNTLAPYWQRLNYGAGTKGTGGNVRGDDEFFSHTYQPSYGSQYSNQQQKFQPATKFVGQTAPRPAFKVPRGFWFSAQTGAVVPPNFDPFGSRNQFFTYGAGRQKLATAGDRNIKRSQMKETLRTATRDREGFLPTGKFAGHGTDTQGYFKREAVFSSGYAYQMNRAIGRYTKDPAAAQKKLERNLVQKPVITAGIEARRFIDAGIRAMYSAAPEEAASLNDHFIRLELQRMQGPRVHALRDSGANFGAFGRRVKTTLRKQGAGYGT